MVGEPLGTSADRSAEQQNDPNDSILLPEHQSGESVPAVDPRLEELRLHAIREYEQYSEEIWKTFSVPLDLLTEEMTTVVWKSFLGKKGKIHYYQANVPIGTTLQSAIDRRLNDLLLAPTIEEMIDRRDQLKSTVLTTALYLWSKEMIPGPESARNLIKQAEKAKYLADYFDRIGKPDHALTQRERSYLLRQKAQGFDVELPKRQTGVTTRVRELYAKLEADGPKERAFLIEQAVASGVHPGTAAVQYAKYRRDLKSK